MVNMRIFPKINKENLFYFKFFGVAFALNFVWENLHSPLYLSNTIGMNSHLLLMLYASLIDSFFIFLAFILVSIINKNVGWKLSVKKLVLFSSILFFVSFIVEVKALITGRWVYSGSMPLIFGIGISPLIQLVITGTSSLTIAKLDIFGK